MELLKKNELAKMKIAYIYELAIGFTNGFSLESYHEYDCSESHWLDFSIMETYNLDTKTGQTINIYDREFDFSNGIPFERVDGMGIMLIDTTGNKYLINGYGKNSGWYSSELELQFVDQNGEIFYSEDVSECQELRGDDDDDDWDWE